MKKKTMNGYIAAVFGILILFIFGLTAFYLGLETLGGKIFSAFAIVFGGLGIGSALKPETIGQVFFQIMENMKKNNEMGRVEQKQSRTKNSDQLTIGPNSRVTIKKIYKK